MLIFRSYIEIHNSIRMTDQSFMFRLLVAELCHDRSKVKNGTLTVAYHFQVQFAAGAWSRSIAATDPNAWPCNWGPLLCYCMSETSTMWGGVSCQSLAFVMNVRLKSLRSISCLSGAGSAAAGWGKGRTARNNSVQLWNAGLSFCTLF